MSSELFRKPTEVLDRLVAAGVELICIRDSTLGAALDVTPPSVDVAHQPAQPIRPRRELGITYRVARKIYRKLKDNKQLRPLLERVRHAVRTGS